MTDLRIGVVGFGLRSSLAREAHRPDEGSRVVAVCDVSERSLTDARDAFGADITTVSDVADLAGPGLDGVIVLTPDDLHARHARVLLTAGVPVYLEKPMAISIADCDELLATARESRAGLYVGHNMRHMPVVLQMRELIASGAIGEVKAVWCRHFVGTGGDFYFKDWHADRSRTTGLLLQKGAHDIDVIHWLAGAYTRRVSAMGALTVYGDITSRRDNSDRRMPEWFSTDTWPPTEQFDLNPVVDVEDLSMVTMSLANGAFATYEQCMYTPDYWRNYTVIGTAGRLENFGDGGDGSVIRVWDRRGGFRAEGDHEIEVRREDGGHGGADSAIMDEWFAFLRGEQDTNTSPIAAREAVATGCTATDSLRGDGSALGVPAPAKADVDWFDDRKQSGRAPARA